MAIGAAKFEAVLQEVWGFARLRGKQGEICEAISAGKDCGVFWATGAGKSICYQLPALAMEKCVCVVSPLVSLMQVCDNAEALSVYTIFKTDCVYANRLDIQKHVH